MSATIMVVDDDAVLRKSLSLILEKSGYRVTACSCQSEALIALEHAPVDLALVDLQLPDGDGQTLLVMIRERWPNIPVILMTAFGTMEAAIAAVRRGAFEFLTKPFTHLDVVALAVQRALQHSEILRRMHQAEDRIVKQHGLDNIIGHSLIMQLIIKMIHDVAGSDATVLITGESGTGKELIARALHQLSPRKSQEFVSCNCGAIAESLLESELFGHVKGAFTGAYADKKGIFENANRGTLFLDEIGDMPLATQVKLLRALQEGEIKRVGDGRTMRVDVRVVAATNQDLNVLMKQGKFRQDLYYRVNVIHLDLPPLRERMDDLEPLMQHFIEKYRRKLKSEVKTCSPEALKLLKQHNWPGNIRELENVIERALVIAKGQQIVATDLPTSVHAANEGGEVTRMVPQEQLLNDSYKEAKRQWLEIFNQYYITELLRRTGGNITKAATLAGMFRSNFKSLMRKCKIQFSRSESSTSQTLD